MANNREGSRQGESCQHKPVIPHIDVFHDNSPPWTCPIVPVYSVDPHFTPVPADETQTEMLGSAA